MNSQLGCWRAFLGNSAFNNNIIITNARSFVLLSVTASTASFMTATTCSEYHALYLMHGVI